MKERRGFPKRLRDLIGMKVRSKRPMSNKNITIPAGTTMTVAPCGQWNDLALQAPACSCCGVSIYIRGVAPTDIELLADGEKVGND